MRKNLIVIDDFFPDPDRIRRSALKKRFNGPDPGSKSIFVGTGYVPPLPFARRIMGELAGRIGNDVSYRRQSVKFLVSTAKNFNAERARAYVHDDSCDWTGFICLVPCERKGLATRFFKHKETGLCGLHDQLELAGIFRRYGCDFEGMKRLIYRHSTRLSKWEEIGRVGLVYNRLILFNGRFFHAASDGFGTRKGDAKLTLNLAANDCENGRSRDPYRTSLF